MPLSDHDIEMPVLCRVVNKSSIDFLLFAKKRFWQDNCLQRDPFRTYQLFVVLTAEPADLDFMMLMLRVNQNLKLRFDVAQLFGFYFNVYEHCAVFANGHLSRLNV